MSVDLKADRDAKVKEIQILKGELKPSQTGPEPELKDLRVKYESIKAMHDKEYRLRKEKESKLEQTHNELQKKIQSLEDIYIQIDSMQDAIVQLEEELQAQQKLVGELKSANALFEQK